ncbi:MAG TPA: 50S ribosomal protein L2 [Candidatus Pacearchaeota archaeon]|nr:50S ribosomal protein L2 [archaeon BMS3Abin17]HDK42420.1 50S ribosomal protein L2 [Candidatus Pacearchaeota archaeon]HDZ60424.1 50S ribosomal protein L2 [Candidatus Pacearchaeota archaeon]
MGKRIIQQRRGRGTHTYKVRRKAFKFKLQYPQKLEGEGSVIKLFNSAAHTAPLAKIRYDKGTFYIPAFKGMIEEQKIKFNGKDIKPGDITKLKNIPIKTEIYNIESRPGDGGVFIKSAGNSAIMNRIVGEDIFVLMPSKKEKKFNQNCRVTIGVIAGAGRLDKPVMKAGKKYHIKKSKSKLWPRTSAVKMNVIDHPFGSGRAKNVKSKIAKRNAPPGRKVGLIRPRRTGKKK